MLHYYDRTIVANEILDFFSKIDCKFSLNLAITNNNNLYFSSDIDFLL